MTDNEQDLMIDTITRQTLVQLVGWQPVRTRDDRMAGAVVAPDGDIVRLIDHTLLKPDATEAHIHALCDEARTYGFATVCVNAYWVRLCATVLRGSAVGVTTVVGFPLGATTTEVKVFEAQQAIVNGATEVDMVMNIGALKGGDMAAVARDVAAVAAACHAQGAALKVILETGLLTDAEKIAGCAVCLAAGADFVKTSTGFGPSGATPYDVALMRAAVGQAAGVKAAGGIRSLVDARRMVEAGASRLGASAGVKIVQELQGVAPASSTPEKY